MTRVFVTGSTGFIGKHLRNAARRLKHVAESVAWSCPESLAEGLGFLVAAS